MLCGVAWDVAVALPGALPPAGYPSGSAGALPGLWAVAPAGGPAFWVAMGTVVLVGVTAGTAYRIARRAAKRRAATLARAAAGLLHDLKGPLTVVLANAELLAEAPADATQRQASLRDVHGKAHGTGLGMTVVRDVARRSGGTASCRSAPGQGTEVTLTLPCPGVGTCGVPN